MPTTVRAAFNEFAARLEPTEAQGADASAKHTGVRDYLNCILWVSSAFLTGSYARHTLVLGVAKAAEILNAGFGKCHGSKTQNRGRDFVFIAHAAKACRVL